MTIPALAARLTDPHLCPQHDGKEIVGATAPTILVEGQPAARITSLVKCEGGPLDKVQIGEPTVLMMGLDAARFLDGTLHGGLVTQGASTVVIGAITCPEKRLRLLARLSLIQSARDKAKTMPDGPEKERLDAAADRLAQNNRAVEDGRLAASTSEGGVYDDAGAPEGWSRVTGDDLPPELRNATFNDPVSGFQAAVYRNEIDGTYRLVFRGSEPSTILQNEGNDWTRANLMQGLGYESQQYTQAVELSKQFSEAYGDAATGLAGHSLGGGLATAGSLASGIPANTFNASGLHEDTIARYGLDANQAGDLINAYQVNHDLLTDLQEHSAVSGLMADALGTKHPIEAFDYAKNADGTGSLTERPDPWLGVDSDAPWWQKALLKIGKAATGIVGLGLSAAQIAESIHRHNNFIGGIELEKSQDIATIQSMTQ